MVNISLTIIHLILFGTDYVALSSTVECNYRLQVERDKQIMRDVDRWRKRVEIIRWITGYVLPLGEETPWIEEDSIDFCCKVLVVVS